MTVFGAIVRTKQSEREIAHIVAFLRAVFVRLALACNLKLAGDGRSKSTSAFVTIATLPLVGLFQFRADRRHHFEIQRRFGFFPCGVLRLKDTSHV